jgi:hypothetical protein
MKIEMAAKRNRVSLAACFVEMIGQVPILGSEEGINLKCQNLSNIHL